MAHPYFHALASVNRYGGQWTDYIALHERLDSSKAHYAHCKHRLALHNTWGVSILTQLLGPLWNAQPTADLLEQHVCEDLGRYPLLSDYLSETTQTIDSQTHSLLSTRRFGGQPTDYQDLHNVLDQLDWPEPQTRQLTHNSWGIYLIEVLYGSTFLRASDQQRVPTRPLLELHVSHELGRIPTLAEALANCPLPRWACRATRLNA